MSMRVSVLLLCSILIGSYLYGQRVIDTNEVYKQTTHFSHSYEAYMELCHQIKRIRKRYDTISIYLKSNLILERGFVEPQKKCWNNRLEVNTSIANINIEDGIVVDMELVELGILRSLIVYKFYYCKQGRLENLYQFGLINELLEVGEDRYISSRVIDIE